MSSLINKHKDIWNKKPILRQIYSQWYKQILSDLSPSGRTLEIGSGSGNFKEFCPKIISSDVEKLPWLDMSFDAHAIPLEDNSLGNVVMIDTLHHLDNPIVFIQEAKRVLKRGGRLIILEPFPSLLSLPVYRMFHQEPFNFNVNYYQTKKLSMNKDPWSANQAIPYLLFFKNRKTHETKFPDFQIVRTAKISFFAYPLSGGFDHEQLIPDFLLPVLLFLERIAQPLIGRFAAFRCYVVLEKTG